MGPDAPKGKEKNWVPTVAGGVVPLLPLLLAENGILRSELEAATDRRDRFLEIHEVITLQKLTVKIDKN